MPCDHDVMPAMRSAGGGRHGLCASALAAVVLAAAPAALAAAADAEHQQARLAARSVLPAATFRPGSPPMAACSSRPSRCSACGRRRIPSSTSPAAPARSGRRWRPAAGSRAWRSAPTAPPCTRYWRGRSPATTPGTCVSTARAFADAFLRLRLEMPSQTVNLASLTDSHGNRVYPTEVAPPAGPVSIGDLKAVNDHQLLVIERDNLGDDERAPRFKKVFLLDTDAAAEPGGHVAKTPLVDLLAIPDPDGIGGDGDFFRLPFYTIESVHVVDERTLLIASDNNPPGSNGRARSRSADRSGPLAADDTELVLVRFGTPLAVDRRLFPPAAR